MLTGISLPPNSNRLLARFERGGCFVALSWKGQNVGVLKKKRSILLFYDTLTRQGRTEKSLREQDTHHNLAPHIAPLQSDFSVFRERRGEACRALPASGLAGAELSISIILGSSLLTCTGSHRSQMGLR